MRLALAIATLVAAVQIASSLHILYVPYALAYSELQPEKYDLVLTPIQEGTLHSQPPADVPSPEEQEEQVFTVRRVWLEA
jgi:hypothetical protein